MFDAEQRLVVCNKLYVEMYGVPADLVQPGTPLQAIADQLIAAGCYSDTGAAELLGWMRQPPRRKGRAEPRQRARRRPLHCRVGAADAGRRHRHHAPGHHRAAPRRGQDRAHGAARHADRPSQPGAARRASRASPDARQARRGGGGAHARSRPLQGRERHARPSGRRQAPQDGDRAAAGAGARDGHGGAHGRRRVRHHPGRHREPPRCHHAGAAHRRGGEQTLRDRGPSGRHRHLRRHRHGAGRRPRPGRADRERGPGAVPRQGRRARQLLLLRAGDGCADACPPRHGVRHAPGTDGGRVRAALSAGLQSREQPDHGLRGAHPLAPSQERPGAVQHVHPAGRERRLPSSRSASG